MFDQPGSAGDVVPEFSNDFEVESHRENDFPVTTFETLCCPLQGGLEAMSGALQMWLDITGRPRRPQREVGSDISRPQWRERLCAIRGDNISARITNEGIARRGIVFDRTGYAFEPTDVIDTG